MDSGRGRVWVEAPHWGPAPSSSPPCLHRGPRPQSLRGPEPSASQLLSHSVPLDDHRELPLEALQVPPELVTGAHCVTSDPGPVTASPAIRGAEVEPQHVPPRH